MTITLAPQTEKKLVEMADREGRDTNALADALLAQVLEEAERDYKEMMAGIERGRQADAEGRSRLFSDYVADVMERRRQRDAAYKQETEQIAA